jgi:hypothetical protein
MSLIDKLAKQSIIQNQLQSQLAEMSYRAINGKRQDARNFKEGMLNIGTAYFNTPQDKLTKEMIMDYKQAEEERYFENDKGLVFEPTGLAEPIKAYVPKEYSTTGVEADETLLNTELDKRKILINELNTLQQFKSNIMKESRNLQRQTTAKEKQYDDKVAELTERQKDLKKLNTELALIDDQITLLTSSTASTSTTVLSSPAATKSAALND